MSFNFMSLCRFPQSRVRTRGIKAQRKGLGGKRLFSGASSLQEESIAVENPSDAIEDDEEVFIISEDEIEDEDS
jgi:hypothetical protein